MEDLNPSPGPAAPKQGNILYVVVTMAILLAIAAAAYLHSTSSTKQPGTTTLNVSEPMSAESKTYIGNVAIEKTELTRAENFLHQEVTTLSGEISNLGNRSIQSLALTVEFFDEMNQAVLRETRAIPEVSGAPIEPQGRRPFEIAFEHIPTSWNMQPPAVHVSALQLASNK